jgi:tetratricopeptide (TPR) repeat protein
MPAELDDSTYAQITEFAAQGDELASQGAYRDAIKIYNKGWELLPEPKSDWSAATWLLAAIADAAYLGGFLTSARQALDYVMSCPDAIGNPFLHLRRGEVLFEQGELDAAADELMRAYMGAGMAIFEREPAKYLNFLKTRALIAD